MIIFVVQCFEKVIETRKIVVMQTNSLPGWKRRNPFRMVSSAEESATMRSLAPHLRTAPAAPVRRAINGSLPKVEIPQPKKRRSKKIGSLLNTRQTKAVERTKTVKECRESTSAMFRQLEETLARENWLGVTGRRINDEEGLVKEELELSKKEKEALKQLQVSFSLYSAEEKQLNGLLILFPHFTQPYVLLQSSTQIKM